MTVRKNWLERLVLLVSGWAIGVLTGLWICQLGLFHRGRLSWRPLSLYWSLSERCGPF